MAGDAGLAVELDSRAHHSDWESAEADRARDAALLAIGIRTVRVTARRLRRERPQLERELRGSLHEARRYPAAGR
jgi:very-short-patch-repair endonuclease